MMEITTFAEIMTVVMVPIIGYVIRLGSRVEVLEKVFEEKKVTWDGVVVNQNVHGNRLTAIEGVLAELKSLAIALSGVPVLISKMDTILEYDRRRLDVLEDHVYDGGNTPRHTRE